MPTQGDSVICKLIINTTIVKGRFVFHDMLLKDVAAQQIRMQINLIVFNRRMLLNFFQEIFNSPQTFNKTTL